MSQIGKEIGTIEVEPLELPAPLKAPVPVKEEPVKLPSPTTPDTSPVGAPGR